MSALTIHHPFIALKAASALGAAIVIGAASFGAPGPVGSANATLAASSNLRAAADVPASRPAIPTATETAPGRPRSLTLPIEVDRLITAPFQERARRSALAALKAAGAAPKAAVAPAAPPRTAKATPPAPNHLWIPSLHISQSIITYACGRTTALANRVYRWGCGGHNNVYLLGHAWGVFKALHDLYVAGRLRTGLVAYWSDATGRVHRFKVTAWQVVLPTKVAWAIAPQPTLSMTLQTCVGVDSRYRLDVRLVSY